ncbi:hypothetical protein MAPG_04191 [Magnaporthiopsis poae ATCC 64411]|uniref:Ent-kaurene oxidase n=1 Tax=Magnaporthiopsis poae (strain ATCC 64411 / 73-15) TaxID=644358 RepID=A0A0C4DW23_MAGP6|nr:hypothetical protein MAPG_04191 [Magnaporthiopsis poae ATCC 64411]
MRIYTLTLYILSGDEIFLYPSLLRGTSNLGLFCNPCPSEAGRNDIKPPVPTLFFQAHTPTSPKSFAVQYNPLAMSSAVDVDAAGLQQPQLESQLLGRLAALELDNSVIIATLLLLVLVPVAASALFGANKGKGAPLVNPPGFLQTETQKRLEYMRDGFKIFNEAKKKHPGKPFKLISNIGRMTVLPPDRANEVKSLQSNLNLRTQFSDMMPMDLPGFGSISLIDHPETVAQSVVTKHLTKRLATVTGPLAKETAFATAKNFGDNPDWVETPIYQGLLDVIARVSSSVFLGSALCRNDQWLDITKNFTLTQNTGMLNLRMFPKLLRPLVYFVDPATRATRKRYFEAKAIIDGLLKERQEERQKCLVRGEPAPVYNDAIEWAEQEANGKPFDATDFQLFLSFAAIHTSSDLITQTMLHLASNPENFGALRQEIIDVLPANGWKKTSLYQLKLLDSAIKEAQRLKPIATAAMSRYVNETVTLEDGTLLPKGELVAVDATNLSNPEKYKNPDKFDMRRFLDIRQNEPGGEHRAQLVSGVADHITFGYGRHICPGRFFAANEIKMILCFLIINYDWKFAPDTTLEPVYFGADPLANPEAKLMCRRRKPEIDLSSLTVEEE